jgi:hypothetical protein
MPKDDRYITRDELERQLVAARVPVYPTFLEGPLRSTSEILKAACEILARRIVPVRGRRHGMLTSERIEHLLRNADRISVFGTPEFFTYPSMVQTDDGIFVDVVVDRIALVAALAEAGFPVADQEPEAIRQEEPLSGGKLTEALNRWARKYWGPDFETLPGREELLSLAREEVSPNATTEQIRALRRLAPEKLRRGGAPTHRH